MCGRCYEIVPLWLCFNVLRFKECQQEISSCLTGLSNPFGTILRSDRFQLNVEVFNCRTASLHRAGHWFRWSGDKSRRYKSDSHLARDVLLLSDEQCSDLRKNPLR